MSSGPRIAVVVPCFNEAARLQDAPFLWLTEQPGFELLFVDDGSTDTTPERLAALCEAAPEGRARVLTLRRNCGKAEAVRLGLRDALEAGAAYAGYFDGDLATPVEELPRLYAALQERDAQMVMGARVALLGFDIQRRASRHYLGRVFATAAANILGMQVYDTQCGAKLLRDSPQLRAALAEPFISRWAFDVELIGRLRRGTPAHPGFPQEAFIELPLQRWHDTPGSKVSSRDMAKVGVELARIAWSLRRR